MCMNTFYMFLMPHFLSNDFVLKKKIVSLAVMSTMRYVQVLVWLIFRWNSCNESNAILKLKLNWCQNNTQQIGFFLLLVCWMRAEMIHWFYNELLNEFWSITKKCRVLLETNPSFFLFIFRFVTDCFIFMY